VKLARGAIAFSGALPWMRALGDRALPSSVKLSIDQAFASLCHHLPDRTLSFGGFPMCVCSRCAGLYAGLCIAALLAGRVAGERRCTYRHVFQVGLALMAADIVTQDLGLHPPWHAVRLFTGAWVGGALIAWMLAEMMPLRAVPAPAQRFSATLSRADRAADPNATVARRT
jgi:uncharacterized membrane protein